MSPKIMGSTLEEHREQTRMAIFAALSRLMGECGFDAISMADLAAEANIGRSTIYNHYHDKESVLLDFVTEEMALYITQMRKALYTARNPIDKLRIYVRAQLLTERTYLMSPGPPLREVLSPEANAKLYEHVKQTSTILEAILRECFEDYRIPEYDPTVIIALIHGALTGRRVPPPGRRRMNFILETERFILRAVRADVPPNMAYDDVVYEPKCFLDIVNG